MIISQGNIDINKRTVKGTSLHIAVKKKAKAMISLLMDYKADHQWFSFEFYLKWSFLLSIKDKDNKTIMEICKDPEIIGLIENASSVMMKSVIFINLLKKSFKSSPGNSKRPENATYG